MRQRDIGAGAAGGPAGGEASVGGAGPVAADGALAGGAASAADGEELVAEVLAMDRGTRLRRVAGVSRQQRAVKDQARACRLGCPITPEYCAACVGGM
ncbi:hypothetical protein IEQ11_25490 [Lysobacter capsici]|uniref:hypothetical protein n=1 Tax=Lysobacter capsici TaxID=435897 RepID=UPI00177D1020|nr:hypothetical protein [Lysobacter capsici]UOF15021.1 hypothetical protein IEQ11_25490 [Lysobacter capsici]